ncbi:MAG: epoxyqueuosine reductase QueH [Patescibacteria group bacterium]|jgi:predicted adenine nucleotide alpha hydrolase (AANH) superfamily ATPase|nr:epoxyqueuosine reductase QueH [Patescibacteria group bacterium]
MPPKLLLHVCCANCGIVPIELLRDRFDLTLFWYNPNIYPRTEYQKRLADVKKLVKIYKKDLIVENNDIKKWFEITKELENEPEGGKRCEKCFQMRLSRTARLAKEKSFDFFATTLSVGPQKRAKIINKLGEKLAKECDLKFYPADFKKQDGFKKSVELSKKYGFYRQHYCGCVFSIRTSKH